MAETRLRCRNCGAPLHGEYCSACGQREGRGDLQFSEALGDFVGEFVTWDSRFWRTLVPLLFRPGFLTAEFFAGRRARYMPPFRLYIFISFVTFLVISLSASDTLSVAEWDADADDTVAPLVIGTDPNDLPEEVRAEVDRTIEERGAAIDKSLTQAAEPTEPMGDAGVRRGFNITIDEDDAPDWFNTLERRIDEKSEAVGEDPSDYIEDLLEYLPQMMFLMLPLFAVLLKILYLFSAFHYLQHLVFALHYHSFVYLLYLFSAAIERTGLQGEGWLMLALFIYLPLALRTTYSSGWVGAVGKSLLLYVSYGVLLVVGLATAAVAVLVAT